MQCKQKGWQTCLLVAAYYIQQLQWSSHGVTLFYIYVSLAPAAEKIEQTGLKLMDNGKTNSQGRTFLN